MALDASKWQVQVNKAIRYTGGDHGTAEANYVTVLELHRWLQNLADDASVSGDDFMDITTVNPTDKKFDTIITLTNGYTLDDAYTIPASEFIYNGSIIQGTGASEAIYDGIKVVANRGCYVSVIQNNAILTNDYWNTQPSGESFIGINPDPANGVCMQFMVKIKTAGANIDNTTLLFTTREWGKTFSEFRIPATGRGVNVVPLQYATDLNNTTASGTVATWTGITNVTAGWNEIDVNQDSTMEEYYSEWNRSTYTINQFYERMKYLGRRGSAESLYGLTGPLFRGITHEVTVDTPDTTGVIAMSVNASLEYVRATGSFVTDGFVTGEKIRASGFTNAGNNVDKIISTVTATVITVTVTTGMVQEAAGTDETIQGLFNESEAVSWTGGTGQLLALNSPVTPTKMWIQLLTGTTPTDNLAITGGSSLASVLMNATIAEKAISTPFCGASTGSAIVGAYGFSLEYVDLAVNDKITALDGTTRQPPNNVTFTVGGILTSWRILVGPEDGAGGLDYDQLSNTNLLSGAAVTQVTVDEAIPANTPTSGTIRIKRADGSYTRHPYSAVNTTTKIFTITSHNFSTNNAVVGADVFISYIDDASSGTTITYNTVQTSTQTLFIEARYGGTGPNYTDSIKPAKTTATLGTTGGSATISAVSDV